MDKKIIFLFFVSLLGVCYGEALSNYDLSRQNKNGINNIGAGYGQYPYPGYGNNYPGNYNPHYPTGPGLYPSGPGYPGNYPGSHYPGNNYPHGPGAVGPPGAHPGCPLCDSSVYSYCSYKQAHDSCCCENSAYAAFNCRKSDCRNLYANSCQEYHLISSCCCIDLQKNAIDPVVPALPVVG